MRTLPILMLLASGGAALAQAQPAAAPVSGRAEAPRQATPSQATPARATPAQAAMPLAPGTQVMTLEQAERLLVDRNLAVIAARRGVDSARAQRLVASSLPPAVVSAGNTFGQFNEGGRPAAGAPNTANITGARFLGLQNNVTVGLQVLVELGGKRTLRTRLAEENIGAAEAQVLDALRSQLYVLRLNFFTALGARANLEVALGNRAGLDRTEALLRRQLRDGAIPEGDLLRFQASRVVFENDVVTNAQAYAAAVAQIAVTLAADAADFRPGEPPAVPARRGATSGDPVRAALSAIAFDVRGRFNTIPDLGIGREELGTAVQDRPDVVAALRQASAAGANLALTEAARWRDVTVNAGFARTRLNQNVPSGTIPLLANDQFSVQLSVPIFTRRIVEGNVGVAAGQAGQADALARGALLQARADFAIAWSAVEQSRNLLRVYTGGALGRAEAAYRSAEQAYTAGGSSLLEVLDALRTLNATRLAANVARTNYLVALAQLEQATGVSGVSPRL